VMIHSHSLWLWRYRASALLLLGIIGLVNFGCGNATEETPDDRVIKSETDVLDVRIFSGAPDSWFQHEKLAVVGHHEGEHRLLLFFPGIERLYDADVILSSVSVIEVIINCREVPVNPSNIKLYALSSPWTAFASWRSRAALLPGYEWQTPGGDIYGGSSPVSPDVRANANNVAIFELSFDVTELVTGMISANVDNEGFVITVTPSELNATDGMFFLTANSDDLAGQPKSALVFTTEDTIE